MEELKGASQEQQVEFAQIMNHNAQRAQMNQKSLNNQVGGAFANMFGGQGQNSAYMVQPQQPMMANFIPMIPGFQPNYRPNPAQAFIIKGGQVSTAPINPYPQYQYQQRPVFAPTQAAGAPVYMSPQRSQPQVVSMSNPLAMVNLGNVVNSNPMHGIGFGNNNHHRSRRF